MKINIKKTKVMVVGNQKKNVNIEINGERIEQVDAFKYLGTTIQNEGDTANEIDERISSATKLFYALARPFIGRREISRKTKMTIYKTIYSPILTYGSDSWVLNDAQKSRLQATEMKYLRRVNNITRRDKIRNEVVREELETESILPKNRKATAKVVWAPGENERSKAIKMYLGS